MTTNALFVEAASGLDSDLHLPTVPLTLSLAAAGDGATTPSFEMAPAYNGGLLKVKGIPLPVVVDLKGVENDLDQIRVLRDHNQDRPVGHVADLANDGRSLRASGPLSVPGTDRDEITGASGGGFRWQASIGGRIKQFREFGAGQVFSANGQTFTGPAILATRFGLREISVVAIGADTTTSVRIAASAAEGDPMPFEQWLKAKGFELAAMNDQQKQYMQAQYDAENPSATGGATGTATEPPEKTVNASADTSDAVADMRKRAADEAKRIGKLNALFGVEMPELKAKAIDEGWSLERAELEKLRAERPKAPAGFTRDNAVTSEVLEASLAITGGLDGDVLAKSFPEKALDTASRKYRRGIGLQELILEAAYANGYVGPTSAIRSDLSGVLRMAFNAASSFSTFSLPGILSNNANKFLLQGFNGVDRAWEQISTRRSVNDFKTITSYRLTGAMQYEKVGPGGQLAHAQLGEESYTNRAETYGIIYSVTRQDIINDDLGALTSVPQKIGRGGALKLNDVFWTAFLADLSTFYTTARGNYIEGATTTLTSAGLKQGVEKFRKQTDADGKPLGVAPRFLLVPPELEVAADELYTSTNNNTGGSATTEKVPNRNVFTGKYQPVVCPYLSNTSYTGNSTTAWYLIADPADLSLIEVAFLNGQANPTVETADADFDTLGIKMRGFHDFGVSRQDHRAAVRSKGAA